MVTIASDNNYRVLIHNGREADWFVLWFTYLPWWINWAVVTPFIVAATRCIVIEEGKIFKFVLVNIGMLLLFLSIVLSLTVIEVAALRVHVHGGDYYKTLIGILDYLAVSPIHLDVLVYFSVACIGYSWAYYTRNKEQMLHNQKLALQLSKTELEALKSQLSPHFLFNTLNTISGLVRMEEKQTAVSALTELSKMFRKVLENQKTQLTTLADEMSFVESYLAIQRMRFEHKLAVDIQVEHAVLKADIPFMLLHTLVENAVQHGSQLESDQNKISLKIKAKLNYLCITLSNSVSKQSDHKGFGIGLSNCKQRLSYLYKGDFSFHSQETEDRLYVTELRLPIGETYA